MLAICSGSQMIGEEKKKKMHLPETASQVVDIVDSQPKYSLHHKIAEEKLRKVLSSKPKKSFLLQ